MSKPDASQHPSYTRLRFSRAYRDTRDFWTGHKVATTLAGPIVVALAWTFFKGWKSWVDVIPVILVSVLAFFALLGITFWISFIRAPALLHREMQSKVVELDNALATRKLTPHHERLLQQLSSLRLRLDEIESNELAPLAQQHELVLKLRNVTPNSSAEAQLVDHYNRLDEIYGTYRKFISEIDECFQAGAALSAESARIAREFRETSVASADRSTPPRAALNKCVTARTYLDMFEASLSGQN